jgi:hypothetical protein
MKNKYWLIVALFLVAVAGAYLVNAIKNRGTTYVVNMNNVVVKYDENAIKSEITNVPNEMKKWFNDYREELREEPFCFSEITPRGLWNENCYESKKECNDVLKELDNANVKKCYKAEIKQAWCVYYVIVADSYHYVYKDEVVLGHEHICTDNKDLCEELTQYQHPMEKTGCIRGDAMTHESHMPYIWSDKDIKSLIPYLKKTEDLILHK